MTSEQAMKRALELALQGTGLVSPNPRVGCVILKDGKVIGEGWHKQFGGDHAEVEAIRSAKESVEGATVVVNLEPCAHTGKTLPCADLLIQKKVGKVVVGMIDPNPLVAGRGVEKLRSAGIEVEVGVLEQDCAWINRYFVKWITTGLPYVVLKVGQSLDGCIATNFGESKWITCEESRRRVHKLRAEIDAILVGEKTVAKDDPELTVRLVKGRNPKRIILDTNLSLPLTVKIFVAPPRNSTFVFCSEQAKSMNKAEALKLSGVNLVSVNTNDKMLDTKAILKEIGEAGISSVLVEGGAEVFSSFITNDLVDELHTFIAPIVIGNGKHSFGSVKTMALRMARKFVTRSASKSGEDIHIVFVKQPKAT